MKRRDFFKYTALSLSPLLLHQLIVKSNDAKTNKPLLIDVMSDQKTAHLVFQSFLFKKRDSIKIPTLIVGGGIAGLTAAHELGNKDFLLCELSSFLGGSSGAGDYKNVRFAQGAHYDLAYPDFYGKEGIEFLKKLNIIDWNEESQLWEFVEKEYTIDPERESICLHESGRTTGLFLESAETSRFEKLMDSYVGKFPMPTRLISDEIRTFDSITMADFLISNKFTDKNLIHAINYQMIDDYGAGIDDVSAFAGIHYYACRPYYRQEVELFSPPEGNQYFAQKIIASLPIESLKTEHLIRSITPENKGFRVEVVDLKKKEQFEVFTEKVIYAGQKHALKHVFPQAYSSFSTTSYAPWVVVNCILPKTTSNQDVFWQNESLLEKTGCMGVVDSLAQSDAEGKNRILTGYYCFTTKERSYLKMIEENPTDFVEKSILQMENIMGIDFRDKVEKVSIKLMGHAMPIATTNYLKGISNLPEIENFALAGVDTGRLPLLFEAIDSGIQAVNSLFDRG